MTTDQRTARERLEREAAAERRPGDPGPSRPADARRLLVMLSAALAVAMIALAVMFAFTLVGWAIFRAPNLTVLGQWFAAFTRWTPVAESLAKPALWLAVHIAPLLLLQWATRRARDEAELAEWPWAWRGLAFALLFLAVASSAASDQEFIYFQF